MIRRFLLQLQFLTRLPVPGKTRFNDRDFARGIVFMPVIGLIIGLFLAGIWYIASLMKISILTVLFVLLGEIIITGGLHYDGLADTGDSLFSNRPQDEILSIMRDSRIGTNGTLAIILVLLFKGGVLISIGQDMILFYLFFMPVFSRMTISWSAGLSPYARKGGGMGRSISENTGAKEIVISTCIALALGAPFLGVMVFIMAAAVIVFAILFTFYAKKKIGGVTGDIFGAIIELSEVVYLIIALVLDRCYGSFCPGAVISPGLW